MLSRLLYSFIFACLCASCSTYTKIPVDIVYKDRQTLVFTGKGAAAGIMLDSVMGGAGIAIGIAIDEGIAKDIAKGIFAVNPDYDFLKIVRLVLRKNKNITPVQKRLLTNIVVNRYGFRTFSGGQSASLKDGASPWISLVFECSGAVREINYPEDVKAPLMAELQDIKTNGQLSMDQLSGAVNELIDHWTSTGGCNTHSG